MADVNRSRWRVLRRGLLAAALGTAGCAQNTKDVTFDDTVPTVASTATSESSSTSSTPRSPVAASDVPSAIGPWVDVTANLVGLDSECGNMSFVSGRPDRDTVIAGVAGQGLWSSDSGSAEWTPLGSGTGSTAIGNRATSIVYDPDEPGRFWESGIYGAPVYETRDDGATFTQLGQAPYADSVSVDLKDPARQTLVIGIHERPWVFRSTNGGVAWEDISAGLPADVGFASFPLVIDPQTYLVGTRAGGAAGVFRTTDGGTTWSPVFPGGVSGPPLVAGSDGRIYWLLEHGGLITSVDAGVTWTRIEAPVGRNSGRLVELPDGRFVTVGANQLLISPDRGASWRAFGPGLPFPPDGMAYAPARQAFYVWRSYCDFSAPRNPVVAESMMRLDVDLGAS